ncbi:MAG: hypothetical protein JW850_06710 [Thermoflexales bacterium]|nr:hypothetical protein [Thermoflexales bacterium]
MSKAVLISVSSGCNLGLAKLANWLGSEGWQVQQQSSVGPLTDRADLYCFSAVFSWDVPGLIEQVRLVPAGCEVWIGGPGVTILADYVERETGIRPVVGADARFENQPGEYRVTRTSRGCPVGCSFCIVAHTDRHHPVEYVDFPPAPVVLDDNILASSWGHQEQVVERLRAQGYGRVDFQCGFDPSRFTAGHFDLYSPLRLAAWRLAFDDEQEAGYVERMITLLRSRRVPKKRIRVYTIAGLDSPEESLSRAQRVIEWGGEPRLQMYRPLDWLLPTPFVDEGQGWTLELATAMPRYFYGYYWRRMGFDAFLVYTRARPFEHVRQAARLF